MEVGGELENLSIISDFIEKSMGKYGLGDREIFQIQLAVDEACTNIIEHAELKEENKISIKCRNLEDKIELVIEDRGKPFDPTTTKPPDLKSGPQERELGGLGVHFIKTFMDEVKYEFREGKNVLTLIKYI